MLMKITPALRVDSETPPSVPKDSVGSESSKLSDLPQLVQKLAPGSFAALQCGQGTLSTMGGIVGDTGGTPSVTDLPHSVQKAESASSGAPQCGHEPPPTTGDVADAKGVPHSVQNVESGSRGAPHAEHVLATTSGTYEGAASGSLVPHTTQNASPGSHTAPQLGFGHLTPEKAMIPTTSL